MATNPFENYQAENSAIFLEQNVSGEAGGIFIRCQLEGRGSDIVHLLATALSADAKQGGVLRQMLLDALEIGVNIDSAEMKIKMHTKVKTDTVN